MKPARKIKASRWIVTDPQKRIAAQFEQKTVGKFISPVYKAVLVVLDWDERVRYRLVDTKTDISDGLLEVKAGEYAIMDRDRPAAKLTWLPREKVGAKGFVGTLKKLMTPSDRAIVSAGADHFLDAPSALAMYLIFSDLTGIPGG